MMIPDRKEVLKFNAQGITWPTQLVRYHKNREGKQSNHALKLARENIKDESCHVSGTEKNARAADVRKRSGLGLLPAQFSRWGGRRRWQKFSKCPLTFAIFPFLAIHNLVETRESIASIQETYLNIVTRIFHTIGYPYDISLYIDLSIFNSQ